MCPSSAMGQQNGVSRTNVPVLKRETPVRTLVRRKTEIRVSLRSEARQLWTSMESCVLQTYSSGSNAAKVRRDKLFESLWKASEEVPVDMATGSSQSGEDSCVSCLPNCRTIHHSDQRQPQRHCRVQYAIHASKFIQHCTFMRAQITGTEHGYTPIRGREAVRPTTGCASRVKQRMRTMLDPALCQHDIKI